MKGLAIAAAYDAPAATPVRVRDAAGNYHRFATTDAARAWVVRCFPAAGFGTVVEHYGEQYQLAYVGGDDDERIVAKVIWWDGAP